MERSKKSDRMASRAVTVQAKQKGCSNCGADFTCGAGETSCWCFDLPHVGVVASQDQDCLCPTCLTQTISKMPLDESGIKSDSAGGVSVRPGEEGAQTPLVEGEDYYLEGAAMVFTGRFLLRRGYCCESGCRHCPYASAEAGKQT